MPKKLLLCASLLTLFASSALAQSNEPFVTVNGTVIPQYAVDAFVAELQSKGAQDSADFRQAVREEMIRRGLLVSEAQKQALDKTPEFKRQMETARQAILMQSLAAEHLKKHPVTNEEMQAAYTAALARLGKTEYKMRHIQVKTETQANEILAKLNGGKGFVQLAAEASEASTKETGGDIGWKVPAMFPPPVSKALQGIEKGRYTKPVQFEGAWHIFYAEDDRPLTPPSPQELQRTLVAGIQQQKIEKFIQELRATATIK